MAADHGNSGLFNAVRSAKETGYLEEMMWVGTLGMPTDSLIESTRDDIAKKFRMKTSRCLFLPRIAILMVIILISARPYCGQSFIIIFQTARTAKPMKIIRGYIM